MRSHSKATAAKAKMPRVTCRQRYRLPTGLKPRDSNNVSRVTNTAQRYQASDFLTYFYALVTYHVYCADFAKYRDFKQFNNEQVINCMIIIWSQCMQRYLRMTNAKSTNQRKREDHRTMH